MIKRITTLVFVFLTIVGNAVWATDPQLTGSGTESDPYQISTATDLKAFRDYVNEGNPGACAKLTADITLNSSEEWEPIGYVNSSILEYSYTGTFDGDGYTIKGLSINDSQSFIFSLNGLFRVIGTMNLSSNNMIEGGEVKNLTVQGELTAGKYSINGGICGYNCGTIQNCTNEVSLTITEGTSIGGICGVNSGTINDCANKRELSNHKSSYQGGCCIGGICGANTGTIEKCYNEGAISGDNKNIQIGGICGAMQDNADTPPTINNCYNVGTLTLNLEETGGSIAGISPVDGATKGPTKTCTITNCHNYGNIISTSSRIGGIFETDIFFEAEVHAENCYYINTIESTEEEEEEEGVEPKSADAFANGEVLYLLQQNNSGVWKQGEEGYPVFIGDEEEETILYKVTFDYNYEGSPEAIVNYLEAGETVTFPTVEREGYTFMNWSTDATGETPVEDITSIALTSDMTYYAQWQSSETEEPGDDDEEDQGNTGIHKPQRPIKYYNIYIDTICPGLDVEVSKDVVQEGHQVSAYLTIQSECDTTGMRFEYKRGLFGYWKDLKELEGVQPGEYIIKNIYTDIYIRALDATLPEEEPTGIEDVEGVKAYAKDGSIYIYTPNREEVTIISMSGAIIKHAEQVGLQSYSVNRGIYIVRIGEKVFKLKN